MHFPSLVALLAVGESIALASASTTSILHPRNAAPHSRHVGKMVKLSRRQVPHEHSHEKFLTCTRTFLNMNNPLGIADPVFALLGAAASSAGVPQVDPDCLQQVVADQAFTNAKAAGDVGGMTCALIFRTLEKNTGKGGQASAPCTSVTATNPEIAALQQHQDAASPGVQALNKQIVLELARQIASIGGDPQQALQSGTFAPGDVNDATGKGNSCDDLNDAEGCIFTRNLLVEDATAAEIEAAVADLASGNAAQAGNASGNGSNGAGAGVPAGSIASSTAAASATSAPVTSGSTTDVASLANAVGNVELGPCSHIAMIFATGLDGRRETSFVMANRAEFDHGSAQNPNIITRATCDTLINKCRLAQDSAGVTTCRAAEAAVAAQDASVLKSGGSADLFNSFFGIQTNFASVPQVDDQGRTIGVVGGTSGPTATVAVPVGPTSAAGVDPEADATATCPPPVTVTVIAGNPPPASSASENVPGDVSSASSAVAAPTPSPVSGSNGSTGSATSLEAAAQLNSNVDLGSCPHIAIGFGAGIEGRKETSFINANTQEFPHGSAQNINIITQFSCDNLVNSCGLKAGDQGVTVCADAEAAVAALNADQRKSGAAADLWNSFFGIATNFGSLAIVDNTGATISAGSGESAVETAVASTAISSATASASANVSSPSQTADITSTAASAQETSENGNSGAAGGGGNIQTFTGALGGIPAPAVTPGGRGFNVADNDSFLTANAALGRSCDVQHNKCANASNSGAGAFSVGDCDLQNNECRAALQ